MTRPGIVAAGGVLPRLGHLPGSLASGPYRLLRISALGAQLIFAVALLKHPRLVIPYLPGLIGGCTFCPARVVTSIDYRRNGETIKVPVCSKHVHDAPASYDPRQQALGNFWLLAPLLLFYGFVLLLLACYGLAMLTGLEDPAPSPIAWWPAFSVLVIGLGMTGIVALHARQMLAVTVFGEEFDAARWLFWLALPLAALVVGAMTAGFSGSVALSPDHEKVNRG